MLAVQVCCARHCELPLSKMGNKGLFPGVAVPLAFFCTLFFRHRKKSVSAPWDGKSHSAPESARHSPPGEFLAAKLSPIDAGRGGFPLAPLHPLRTVVGVHIMGQDLRLRAHQSAFLRPTHLRRPHCREYRPRFAQTTGPCPLPPSPSHCLFPFPERRPPYVHSL